MSGALNGGFFGVAASNYAKIAEVDNTGTVATILFSNIPQNYKHLIIVGSLFNTWTGGCYQVDMWWNQGSSTPSSGSDYKYAKNYTYNTTATYAADHMGGTTKFSSVAYSAYGGDRNTAYGDGSGFEMIIPRYSSSGHDKGFASEWGAQSYSEGNKTFWGYSGGNKHNTAPITEICFYSGVNFGPDSKITIYGLIEAA